MNELLKIVVLLNDHTWRKENGVTAAKSNECVLCYWKTLAPGIRRPSTRKRVQQAMIGEVYRDEQCPADDEERLMQLRELARLSNTVHKNQLLATPENCKFPVQVCTKFSTAG